METAIKPVSALLHPLNDPDSWGRGGEDVVAPLSETELAIVQKQVDSILGTTRDNKSIAQIVWNGDKRYWREEYIDWDVFGQPTIKVKRPFLLYKTIFDKHEHFIKDIFVPRYLVLTRIEAEQFASSYAQDTRFYCPERQRWVSLRPSEPPKEMFVWFKTIAKHTALCCQVEVKYGVFCYGNYRHPASFLTEARDIRKGMELAKLPRSTPFDSPDQVSRKLRERGLNNYGEQAMRKYLEKASYLIEENPFLALSDKRMEQGGSFKNIHYEAKERLALGAEALERKLKKEGHI